MSAQNGPKILKGRPTKRVLIVLCLTAIYMVAEAIGGFLSGSLSLLADAGHMLADVAALSISLMAFMVSSRPANHKATFGHFRAEVIAAFINGVLLLVVAFFIVKEALARFFVSVEIESNLMISVGFGGLLINLVGLVLLHQDKKHSLNIRGAWLHVFSDMLGSVGVVISGVIIYFFGFTLVDSIASIIIAGLVAYSSTQLVLETLRVLMEHTPRHIDAREVHKEIISQPGVLMLHDLHIWSITSGKEALSVHVVAKDGADYNALLAELETMLKTKFNIEHTTIQIEKECQIKPC